MASENDRPDGESRPQTTLDLLWRVGGPTVRRGPRKALSVDAVVAAAIALADDEGLDAVTMRRIAQTLGVAPMTLYTYVPGKSELIELMLDALYADMPRTETPGAARAPRAPRAPPPTPPPPPGPPPPRIFFSW
jgi:AcrR family transcriptional regulator